MTEILTVSEVASHFRVSVPTLKRWLMMSRRGRFDLPMTISPKGCRLLWRREDIENWQSRIGNEPTQRENCTEAINKQQ